LTFKGQAISQPLMRRSGQVLVAAQLAVELGVLDIDGRQPTPLTLETA
jgi:dehydrogenase/reductase SDR family member 1